MSFFLFLLALATTTDMSTYAQLVEFNVPDLCLCQLSFMGLGLGLAVAQYLVPSYRWQFTMKDKNRCENWDFLTP